MTFFLLFFPDADAFASLVLSFIFNKDFGGNMTTFFNLEDGGGSLGSESMSNEDDEMDYSIVQTMKSLMNFILTEDLNLLA